MFKATETFIKNRTPFTSNFSLKVISNVKIISGGLPNQCYFNAHKVKEDAAKKGKKLAIVSGWMVNEHDVRNNCTAIIAHWWNMDENNNHIDSSPVLGKMKRDYVQDAEIFNFCLNHDEKLSVHQHFSLLHINGKYETLIDEENFMFKKIDSLRTEYFYNLL
jgi:hypothetical protein